MDDNLSISLVETIKKSDLKDIVGDLGEVTLDSVLNDGILRDIPIINTMTKLIKIGVTIKDFLFIKKLFKFLTSLREINLEDRKKLITKLEADPIYNQKVGENILILLDRMDNLQKPKFMAKAFKAYLYDKINGIELQRINYAIDRILVCDIPELLKFCSKSKDDKFDIAVEQNFINSGFAYVASGLGVGGVHPNAICRKFIDYILND